MIDTPNRLYSIWSWIIREIIIWLRSGNWIMFAGITSVKMDDHKQNLKTRLLSCIENQKRIQNGTK